MVFFLCLHYKITEKMALNDVEFNTLRVVLPLFTTTSVATFDPDPNQNLTMTQTRILALSLTLTLTLIYQISYGANNVQGTS